MRVGKGRVEKGRAAFGRGAGGVDACMEVDGRVGERRRNIYTYIKKDINMGRLYNYYQ